MIPLLVMALVRSMAPLILPRCCGGRAFRLLLGRSAQAEFGIGIVLSDQACKLGERIAAARALARERRVPPASISITGASGTKSVVVSHTVCRVCGTRVALSSPQLEPAGSIAVGRKLINASPAAPRRRASIAQRRER